MIKLQFVREADVVSDAIAWFSQGHVSHVDAVIPRTGLLLGARSDKAGAFAAGVQIRQPDYAEFAYRVVMAVPATKAQENAFYGSLVAQVGKPYDRQAIWGFVLGRDWREKDSWICSELQAAALEASGVLPKLWLAANKITPNMLAFGISAAGGYVTV